MNRIDEVMAIENPDEPSKYIWIYLSAVEKLKYNNSNNNLTNVTFYHYS